MKTDMSKSLRLFLFLLFVAAFLISAPVVVLYTAGYRFDLTHGRIVHTAVLNISSEPRNATVLVDTAMYSDRTPAVLETILPGDHLVRLEKTGYLPWETTLSFESREARVMGPIVLFLEDEPHLQESLSAILVSSHEATNRFAYVTQQSSWLEVWMVEAADSQKKLLMRLPYTSTSTYSLSWSKDGIYIALKEQHGSRQDLSISRVSDGTAIDLPVSAQGVEDSWWDLSVEPTFYVRTGTTLTRIDVQSGTDQLLPFAADLVTLSHGREITLSTSNNRAVLSYQENETASIITYLPLGEYRFVPAPEGLVALSDIQRNRLILVDTADREQPILLNEEATLWKWHPSGDGLLFSSGYDLKRYVRSAHETQTLTRLSTQIEQLDWHPKGANAIYRSDGTTVALNLDGSTTLSQTILATGLKGSFWISPDGKMLSTLLQTETGLEWWTRMLQN